MALDIDDEAVPPVDLLKAQAIEHPPRERAPTDVYLDGGGEDLAEAEISDGF